jgi:two-component system, NtrC family, response regulator AtoC
MSISLPTDVVTAPLHETLIGRSAAIQEVGDLILRLAESSISVLIAGESGTGKDICARLLHKLSPRAGKAFIKVNCPAIPESILESELFGYERGAFTGARSSKPGRFELAHRGTIFLDEIAETSKAVQGKLLQVLDGEPIMRIGGVQAINLDVRVIAATNISLEQAVQEGRLREDIYFRLSEVIIRMPSLRERREDIPLLAEHFNYNFCQKLGRTYTHLPAKLMTQLQGMEWPGNARELAASVKKFVTTGNPEVLLTGESTPENGQPIVEPPGAGAGQGAVHAEPGRKFEPLKDATRRAVEETERQLIEEALRYTLWNRRKAAKLLDISYSSLLRRIDAYKIGKSGTSRRS